MYIFIQMGFAERAAPFSYIYPKNPYRLQLDKRYDILNLGSANTYKCFTLQIWGWGIARLENVTYLVFLT